MKRLKMAIAALLAFALLPLIGSTALADESSASSRDQQIRAAANIETIADASTTLRTVPTRSASILGISEIRSG